MGRPRRIQFPGACYAIVLRGNNRQDIFLSNQDRRCFLSLLRGHKDRYGLKVYAYCLMPQEAHLLIETTQANLAVVMQAFNTVYTKYFNAQHNTVGHVFQGRYKALLVDKDRWLLEMTRTIHLEPARSGLQGRPWRYQWSSCSAYVESDLKEPLVDSDAVLERFGRSRLKQSVAYLRYLKDSKAAAAGPPPVLKGLVVGDEAFLSKILAASPGGAAPRHSPEAEARRIVAEMAARHGLAEEKLMGRLQWREVSAVRKKTIHRIWKETRMGVTELARLFRRTPSAVSQVIRTLEGSLPR